MKKKYTEKEQKKRSTNMSKKKCKKSKIKKEETLADIAEKWWKEKGHKVPMDRRTKAWKNMYKKWHTYAFKDFRG